MVMPTFIDGGRPWGGLLRYSLVSSVSQFGGSSPNPSRLPSILAQDKIQILPLWGMSRAGICLKNRVQNFTVIFSFFTGILYKSLAFLHAFLL